MNHLQLCAAASLFALLLATPTLYAESEVQVRQNGTVSYVSGGVSEEERDTLQARTQGFNLKLVLATRRGAYLSDVNIVVHDAQGRPVLDARSEGPWFYAKLPTGKYQIAASANGTTVQKSVTIASQGRNLVDFRWDD